MEGFYVVMRQVMRCELDADSRAFENFFDDPNMHEGERHLITSVMLDVLRERAVVFNPDLPTTGEEV
jgi:hypothetical protein